MPTLLASKDVATWLGVSEATLSRWRTFGGGPAWVNLGGNIRYLPGDVEAYVQDNRKERHGRC
ncbi:helix-turn-helix transcriptional regulator [Curtobacterium poinsettiae]|uniref:helix-turn-helix transcriptional regulator n=1 Tax=Curtobacterium TaxID=2034 RepID=UPI0028779729|nr:helix-turn-helix domain-containing protein [Curtobacterium flaccumfaciens]